uniref:Uncharacterized protein n=1 Tax=Scleropages formosus TaxID=113540 RepID=A0A8D0CK46_SCLFO
MSEIANSCQELISSRSLVLSVDMTDQDGRGGSQFYREIKQEVDQPLSKLYARESDSPYSVRVEDRTGKQHHAGVQAKPYFKKEEAAEGGAGHLCKIEGVAQGLEESDSHPSFNREQIIVEVNLNNQTLNVSKGTEGKSSSKETAAVLGHGHGKEQDVEEEEEGEEEEDHEEEENDEVDEDSVRNGFAVKIRCYERERCLKPSKFGMCFETRYRCVWNLVFFCLHPELYRKLKRKKVPICHAPWKSSN